MFHEADLNMYLAESIENDNKTNNKYFHDEQV